MEKANRVLQVIGRMNRGGAETMLMNLYRNIDRDKVQFDFVEHTADRTCFDDEIESLGGKIYRCPRYTGKNHFTYKNWWKDFFEKHHDEYQIIHGHIGSTAAIYLSIANRYGLYTIAHSHSAKSVFSVKSLLYRVLSYPTRNIADHFFACSDKAAFHRFGRKVANSKNCDYLKNAIMVDQFTYSPEVRVAVRHELGLTDDTLVIGTVGRLTRSKNPFGIIEILKAIKIRNPSARFLWVGEGEMRQEIEKLLRLYELTDMVIMTGVRFDVERMLQAMDAFIFPSLREGLPVALIEAQAAGLPCFCSDVVSSEVAITSLCSFLPLPQPELWAEQVLSTKIERTDMSEQIKAAGYDVKTTSHWLEEFYSEKCH